MAHGQTSAQVNDRPRFRQDLVAEPIEEVGGRFIDVVDPDSGNGFRFYEVEYSLACAMDGERDIEGIVRWATEELGLTPSANEVRTVIATLGDLGYLEGAGAGESAAVEAATSTIEVAHAPAAVAGTPPTSAALAASARAAAAPTREAAPAAPAIDDELAPGVIHSKGQAASESLGDFELGHVARSSATDDALPKAPDFQLGTPGRVETPRGAPSAPKVDDIPLGAAGSSGSGEVDIAAVPAQSDDMSLDLSDHIAIRPEDVKDAVRQSRVMSAVDVPKDLMDQLDEPAKPAPIAAVPAPASPAPAPSKRPSTPAPTPPAAATTKPGPGLPVPGPAPVAAKAPAAKPAEAAKPAAAAKAAPAAKPAVDLPAVAKSTPAPNEPVKSAPPAPQGRTSPLLIALMIVVVIAGAGFLAWKYIISPDDAADDVDQGPKHKAKPPKTGAAETGGTMTGSAAMAGSGGTTAGSAAPATPTAKLASETLPGSEVKATMAGSIEWVAPDATAVKAGDVIARLVGHKQIETDLAALAPDIEKRVPAEIAAADAALATATTANDKAGIAAAQARLADRHKSLETKQATQAAKQAELAKYLVNAPVDGNVTAVAKVGAKVTPDDVIAKVGGGPAMTATFAVPSLDAYKLNAPVQVTIGDKPTPCSVASLDGGKLKVACAADAGAADSAAQLK